ncbi:MAG: porin [Gemmatimonadota bacterium]
MTRTVTTVVLALGISSGVTAQTIEAGALKLKLGGRVQAQFSTTSVDESELIEAGRRPSAPIPSSMFETRRIRLQTDLEYGDMITGKIELEFGMARVQVRETYFNMRLDPAFQFRFGQWKKPFSQLQLTSSSRWLLIERGVRIRGLNEALLAEDADTSVLTIFRGNVVPGEHHDILERFGYLAYDLGAAVHGTIGNFGYQVGAFNGEGADANDQTNGKSFAARATYKLLESTPLTFGAGVSTREIRLTSNPTIQTRDGTAFEIDLELGDFRRKGLHIQAEATTGTNLAVDETFKAAQLVAGWFQPVSGKKFEGWELAGRASWGDPIDDLDGDEGLLVTPGFNIYFTGRNRFMVNWDVYMPRGGTFENLHAFRAQAQVYF